MNKNSHPASALLFLALAAGGCLTDEEGLEAERLLQLDVRTEHADERPEWWLLARLKILGETAPPQDPNAPVAELRLPGGGTLTLRARDWDADQLRYEISGSSFFAEQVASGTYVASVPGRPGLADTVQDTLQVSFLPIAQLIQPAHGEFLRCDLTLRWSPVPGAARYQVLLRRRSDHATVLSDTVESTELPLPPDLLEGDAWYEWKVYAFDRSLDGDVDNQSKSRFRRFYCLP